MHKETVFLGQRRGVLLRPEQNAVRPNPHFQLRAAAEVEMLADRLRQDDPAGGVDGQNALHGDESTICHLYRQTSSLNV
jgi:hypothetical protein